MKLIKTEGYYLAKTISIISVISIIYFITVMGFKPGILCWIQIVLMISVMFSLGLNYKYKPHQYRIFSIAVSSTGVIISIYHIAKQKLSSIPSQCIIGKSACNEEYLNIFGFISLPSLALLAFFSIALLVYLSREEKYS
ncbi:disulfide bond formation protein B [Paenibacillus sp. FSL M7-0420]|uniref:disulfide bond formation protein B n=1 Tax=Paenibacillus sp. FSL M7-0420 TaxID=2921609 RepID=UPI004040A1B7